METIHRILMKPICDMFKLSRVEEASIGVERSIRKIPPAHFIFWINSFSLLSETGDVKQESGTFEAYDKNWKLCIYPKGNNEGGRGHISLYLQIADTDKLPLGWEVYAKFSLFVYDLLRDRYLTIQDVGGKVRHFHRLRTQWGFDQLLPLSTFKDPSNGYLVDDECMFGAEILVVSNAARCECLSMVKDPRNTTYTWTINNFASKKNGDLIFSEEFTIEGHKWKLCLCPLRLSLHLELSDSSNLPHGRKLCAEYKLRILDQLRFKNLEKQVECVFGGSPAITSSGFSHFMHPLELESAGERFLVNDTLMVEVEFMFLSKFSEF